NCHCGSDTSHRVSFADLCRGGRALCQCQSSLGRSRRRGGAPLRDVDVARSRGYARGIRSVAIFAHKSPRQAVRLTTSKVIWPAERLAFGARVARLEAVLGPFDGDFLPFPRSKIHLIFSIFGIPLRADIEKGANYVTAMTTASDRAQQFD